MFLNWKGNDNGMPYLIAFNGPLTRYVKYGLYMLRQCRERFPRHRLQRKPLVIDPGMRHPRAVIHVGIANLRWQGKNSQHSRRMRNPQFYVSGKRPMSKLITCTAVATCVIGWDSNRYRLWQSSFWLPNFCCSSYENDENGNVIA